MKLPELVIFDVDGLLLDTEAVWQKAWEEVGEHFGIKHLGTTTFLKVVGHNGKEVEDIVKQELSYLPDPLKVLEEARKLGMLLLEEQLDRKPGVMELLDLLNQLHIKKAVATVTAKKLSEERLKKLDLLHRFDHIVCGDEVVKRKPDPEIYLRVVSELQINARNALVLEDSPVGVLAAYRAGIPCIMVPDSIAPDDTQKNQTLRICGSLLEVKDFLTSNEWVGKTDRNVL